MPTERERSNAVYSPIHGSQEGRGRSNAVYNAPILRSQDKIWCPGVDPEMKDCAQGVINDGVNQGAIPNLMLYHTLLEYGKKELGAFAPESKLYILCHGHGKMPLFTCNDETWTAKQIAEMLEKDGLPKTQRVIELLVCHAGESVSTKKGWEELKKARDKHIATVGTAGNAAAKANYDAVDAQQRSAISAARDKVIESRTPFLARGYQGPLTKLETEFNSVSVNRGLFRPQHFEIDPVNYLLPLAAQLTQALRERGYSYFLMISYKAEVCQEFNPKLTDNKSQPYYTGPGVYLTINKIPFLATSKPDLRAVWM